jgi:hypothetical protein
MVKELRNGWDLHEKQGSDRSLFGQPFGASTAIKWVKSVKNEDDRHLVCSRPKADDIHVDVGVRPFAWF